MSGGGPTASSSSATCGTTAKATAPPNGTAARPATWTRAPGSSARAWPASPRWRSPSCSPAASSPDPKKTLLFNDSVQDAAHRAGFVASRSYSFSLRTLLAAVLDSYPGRQASLNDLIADVIASASDPHWLPAVVPPDLQGRSDVDALLAGESQGDADTWRLISERLAFQVVLEFGLRSRQGRTLELTRTAAAEVVLDDPARIAALARDLMIAGPDTRLTGLPPPEDFIVLIRGILERLRVRRRRPAPLAERLDRAGRHPALGHDLGQPARRHARVPDVEPHQARGVRARVPARPAQGAHRVRRGQYPAGLVHRLDRPLPGHPAPTRPPPTCPGC